MWNCHKCGKPVYFAERKQSLGYDWHPECLRCEECGKRLNPGQHAEHKGVPYCHVPCYGALFGPQLFGHGTRVESHKSFGVKGAQRPGGHNGPNLPRDHLESKLKAYNQFYDNKSMEIRSREVNNRLVLEGALRVYWGVQAVIHLKEDDDQRTFVVRKRNSCRVSRAAAEDSTSDKENDASDSLVAKSTVSEVDGLSTDISLSESMTFDSCSLNEYPISDLPTTPEEVSANITENGGALISNGAAVMQEMRSDSSDITLYETADSNSAATTTTTATPIATKNSCISSTLPSKLEKLEKLDWDEIDDLLQVERRISEKDKIYETMPAKLPSSAHSSAENSTSNTASSTQNSTTDDSTPNTNDETTNSNSNSNSPSFGPLTNSSNSASNFITATTSLSKNATSGAINSVDTTTTTTTLDNGATTGNAAIDDEEDAATLKPMDFEDFKRSVHQDYVNGANSFLSPNDGTLKRNQPIDPSRINDSLKFYGENAMSKSFNCEHALRSVDSIEVQSYRSNTVRGYPLQKSGSACAQPNAINTQGQPQQHQQQQHNNQLFEKGINRSKSGPSCFVYSDSSDDDDNDATLKPQRSATIRRSDVALAQQQQQQFVNIKMNCYQQLPAAVARAVKCRSECDSSRTDASLSSITYSGAAAGDELTQSQQMFTAVSAADSGAVTEGDDPPLHVTEDGVVLRRPPRTGAAAIKRRSGNRRSRTKLKRRCSINGHFYNRETSFFTPPYGSQMSVWVTSLVTTQEVINLILEKYKVDSSADNFTLFIIRDNGEQKRLKDNDYPLITRVMLGPHEDVARLFLVDARKTDEISNEVAQFLNLSLPECRAILDRYDQESAREVAKIKEKYAELRRRIVSRMESLKVHL